MTTDNLRVMLTIDLRQLSGGTSSDHGDIKASLTVEKEIQLNDMQKL